jgi:hypothetical protein
VQRAIDAIDATRKRTDATAKVVGGLGTSAVTAVGIAKFADVFPFPPDQDLAVAGLLIGFVAMAAVIAHFTGRLWAVNANIVMKSDPDEMDDVDPAEREVVRVVYQQVADLNQAPTLRAYEARRFRLLRTAGRVESGPAEGLKERAAEIESDIGVAQVRAALAVVRRRATRAVTDATAGALYATFLAAVVLFGISADRLDSERAGRITTAKSCAEAAKENATSLPPICGTSTPATQPTAAEIHQEAVEALGTALGKCEATRVAGSATDRCAELAQSLVGSTR